MCRGRRDIVRAPERRSRVGRSQRPLASARWRPCAGETMRGGAVRGYRRAEVLYSLRIHSSDANCRRASRPARLASSQRCELNLAFFHRQPGSRSDFPTVSVRRRKAVGDFRIRPKRRCWSATAAYSIACANVVRNHARNSARKGSGTRSSPLVGGSTIGLSATDACWIAAGDKRTMRLLGSIYVPCHAKILLD